MKTRKSLISALLLVVALGIAMSARAVLKRDVNNDLRLQASMQGCDSEGGTHKYRIDWVDYPKAGTYRVTTGNHCSMGSAVCKLDYRYTECQVTCVDGRCSAQLGACGPGGPYWVKVIAEDGSLYGELRGVGPPEKCVK